MTEKTKITINTHMTNKANVQPVNLPIYRLSEDYYLAAERIGIHIDKLKAELKARPEPETAEDLKQRIETLRKEKNELTSVAGKLMRDAAPPPIHPSLLRRERDAS
jgi:hypothetical protein